MPEIQVDWHSRQEADRLRKLRDRHGMVWRGVLLEGAKHAESIDLLKALTELHPELATALPGSLVKPGDQNRSGLAKELHAQIRERQRIRATTEVSPSAFDEETDTDAQRPCKTERDHTPESEDMEVQPSGGDTDRARAYKQWDAQEVRAVEETDVLHLDTHDDVWNVLRRDGKGGEHHDDELDEWEVYGDYLYDYEEEY
ncbi:hypothetical protein EXE51_08230 [Halorubrum sp. CGM5_25_10-8B]|uniref:hypothetical protein n=1 Tax=Halorubrum sp. CGM5_25_10-8B TaxID=2518115 RepID=UPI0010F9F2BE|nr:hypothetical protein [Halorubrum sp. CGM5_25_10-8B]TKX37051.1 hypothetical protein EXE51_08230 [Halorubrum sp. CGM5_25_10-8B]